LQDRRIFDAILTRHTNRKTYEDRDIPESVLQILQNQSADDDLKIYLTSDPETLSMFGGLVVQADKIQYGDPNYRSELGHWLGQGVMGSSVIKTPDQRIQPQLKITFDATLISPSLTSDLDLFHWCFHVSRFQKRSRVAAA
jgi:hypothetical protein